MPAGIEVTIENNIYQSYGSVLVEGNSNSVYLTYPSVLIADPSTSKIYSAYVSVLVPVYEAPASNYKPRQNHRSFTMF